MEAVVERSWTVAAWEEMADSLAVRTFGTVGDELVLRWDFRQTHVEQMACCEFSIGWTGLLGLRGC